MCAHMCVDTTCCSWRLCVCVCTCGHMCWLEAVCSADVCWAWSPGGCGREKFVYDLRFLRLPEPSGFLCSSESAHMAGVENTTVGRQPLTHSESPQAARGDRASHPVSSAPPAGCAPEDPCSTPTAQRGPGNLYHTHRPGPLLLPVLGPCCPVQRSPLHTPRVLLAIPALPSLSSCPTSQHCLQGPATGAPALMGIGRARPPGVPSDARRMYMLVPGGGLSTSGSQSPVTRRPGPVQLPAAAPVLPAETDGRE